MKKNATVLNTVVNDPYNYDKFQTHVRSHFQRLQNNTVD